MIESRIEREALNGENLKASYNNQSKYVPTRGGMCERLKQAVLKTA